MKAQCTTTTSYYYLLILITTFSMNYAGLNMCCGHSVSYTTTFPLEGGWGFLMSPSCLESQGCLSLIPLFYIFCPILLTSFSLNLHLGRLFCVALVFCGFFERLGDHMRILVGGMCSIYEHCHVGLVFAFMHFIVF